MSEVVGRLLRCAVIASMVLWLAGCASDEDEDNAPCPAAKVLGEPSELTRFRDGDGRDPTDVLFEARMMRVVGECSYDADGGEIEVELEVLMDVIRGPALDGGAVSFGYFVTVTELVRGGDSEPVIRNKETFPVETTIPTGRRGLRYRDLLEITIPRPDNRSVENYVLYLGFALTEDELSYNKRKLGY